MEVVNMHEAKTRLSQLVDKAAKGEPVVIARAGKPVARVTAIDSPGVGEQKRTGFLAGQFAIPDDFDHMGEEVIAEMFGGSMNLLLDTHLLLWAASDPQRLSADAMALIEDNANRLYFSAASLWEVVIKNNLGRADFRVDPHLLRRGLVENGYLELPITAQHTLALSHLPPLHKDPFDRILVAQAESEGIVLLTGDEQVANYPGPVRKV